MIEVKIMNWEASMILGTSMSLSEFENLIGCPVSRFAFTVDIPIPRKIVVRGAAKQPVKAIWPNPFLAIEIFATKSPIEFPQEITVKPRIVEGIPEISPNSCSKSIMMFAVTVLPLTVTLSPLEMTLGIPCFPTGPEVEMKPTLCSSIVAEPSRTLIWLAVA